MKYEYRMNLDIGLMDENGKDVSYSAGSCFTHYITIMTEFAAILMVYLFSIIDIQQWN